MKNEKELLSYQIFLTKNQIKDIEFLYLQRKYPIIGYYEGFKTSMFKKELFLSFTLLLSSYTFYDQSNEFQNIFLYIIGINLFAIMYQSVENKDKRLKDSFQDINETRNELHQQLKQLRDKRQNVLLQRKKYK